MRFDDLIDSNPELLIGLINESDVQRIAILTGKSDDEHTVNRLSYELGLHGTPGINGPQIPLILSAFDAIDEIFYRKNKQEKSLLSKNDKKTIKALEMLAENSPLINEEQKREFKQQIQYKEFDINKLYRKKYDQWGWRGFYTIYILKAAQLYIELADQPYRYDWHGTAPITNAGLFVWEFHKLLNQISAQYKIQQISESVFRTAGKFARKANEMDDISFASLFTAQN